MIKLIQKVRKSRLLRALAIVFLALVLLSVCVLYVLPGFLNLNPIKTKICHYLSKKYQIEAQIRHLEIKLLPRPCAILKGMSLKSSKWEFGTQVFAFFPSLRALIHRRLEAELYLKHWELRLLAKPVSAQSQGVHWNQIKAHLFKPLPININRIGLFDGKLVIVNKHPLAFDIFSLEASGNKEQWLIKAFARNCVLNLRIQPEAGIEGRVKSELLDLAKLPFWPTDWPRVQGKVRFDATVHYVPQEELNVGFDVWFNCLREPQTDLRIDCGQIQGSFLKDAQKERLKICYVQLKYPSLEGSGEFYKFKNGRIGYDFKGQNIDIAEVRTLALKLLSQSRITRTLFAIVKSGQFKDFYIEHQAPNLHEFKKANGLKIKAITANTTVDIPGANLTLTQASGQITVNHLTLYGQDISGKVQNAQLKDGRFTVSLKRKPGIIQVRSQFKSSLKQGIIFLKHFVKTPAITAQLSQIKNPQGEVEGRISILGRQHHVNQIVVAGRLRQARLNYPLLPYSLRVKNADFKYLHKPSLITISHLKATLGQSLIKDLNAKISFANHQISLNTKTLTATLSLDEVYSWLSQQAFVRSLIDKIKLKGGQMGLIKAHFRLNFKKGKLSLLDAQLPFLLRGVRLNLTDFPQGLFIKDALGQFSPDSISFNHLIGQTEDGDWFNLQARWQRPAKSLFLRGELRITSLKLESWLQSLTHLPNKWRLRLPLKTTFILNYQPNQIAFKGNFYQKHITGSLGELLKTPKKLVIKKLQIHQGNQGFELGLQLNSGACQEVRFSFKGELTNKLLNQLFLKNPYPHLFIKGYLDGSFNPLHPQRSRLSGHLEARDLKSVIVYPGLVLKQLLISASGKIIDINQFEAIFKKNDIEGSGQIVFKPHIIWVFGKIVSPFIDLNSLQGLSARHKPCAHMPIAGQVNYQVGSLVYKSLKLNDLQGYIDIKTLSDIKFVINQGRFCKLHLKGSWEQQEKQKRLTVQMSALKANFEAFYNCLMKKQKRLITGQFSLKSHIDAWGIHRPLEEHSSGSLVFHATKGRIYKMTLMARIFSVLNVLELFKGRLPDLEKEGFAYKKFDIEGQLKNGVFKITSLVIDSSAMKIVGQGKITVPQLQVKMELLVAPLRTIDIILSHIPLLGKVLTGKSSTFVSVPLEVTGSLNDPKVKIIPLKGLAEGTFNVFKRLIKLPVTVFSPAK